MAGGLRLKAADGEDLAVISAMLQDAILPLPDMAFLPDESAFLLVANRFRWEAAGDGLAPHERVHCALRFSQVAHVAYRGFDPRSQQDEFLCLLSVTAEGEHILLHLAGGGDIRLTVHAIDLILADQGEPWPAASRPAHPVE